MHQFLKKVCEVEQEPYSFTVGDPGSIREYVNKHSPNPIFLEQYLQKYYPAKVIHMGEFHWFGATGSGSYEGSDEHEVVLKIPETRAYNWLGIHVDLLLVAEECGEAIHLNLRTGEVYYCHNPLSTTLCDYESELEDAVLAETKFSELFDCEEIYEELRDEDSMVIFPSVDDLDQRLCEVFQGGGRGVV